MPGCVVGTGCLTVRGMSLLSMLGWLLAVMALVIVLPQLRRLQTSEVHEGFSLRSASLASASCLAWVAYTVVERDVPALASSLLPLFVWIACGVIVSRRRDVLARFTVTTGAMCTGVLAVGLLTEWFHVVAVSGSLVWILPQVRSALLASHLPAVSAPTYVLLFVENVGWIVYALGTGRLAYMFAPLVQAPLAALIAFRAARSVPQPPLESRTGTIPVPASSAAA